MDRTCLGSLVVALAVVFAAGCGGDKSASKPKGNEPAGSVVELSGDVVAKQGEAKRALKVGDKVMANETIVTAAKASVAIVLIHNEARWELSGGKSRAISQSLAWNMPKGSGASGAKPTDKTMAAGRHAERQAGTTTPIRDLDSVSKADDDEKAPGKPVAPGDVKPEFAKNQPAPPPPAGGVTKKASPPPPPPPAKKRPQVAKPRPPMVQPPRRRVAKKSSMRRRRRSKKGGAGPNSAGNPLDNLSGRGVGTPLRTRGGGGGQGFGVGHGRMGAGGGGKKKSRAKVHLGATSVVGDLDRAIAARFMRRYRAIFRFCYEQDLKHNPNLRGSIKLKLHLATTGHVTRVTVSAVKSLTAKSISCLIARAKRIRFPARAGSSVEQALRFTPQ